MLKKISLALALVLIIGGGTFYFLNSKDNYDASQYSAYVPAAFSVGSKLDFTLPDQYGEKHTLNNDTKKLILTFAKDASHIMKDFLKQEEKGYLNKQSALYIADISTAPAFIRNVFILPNLQKSSYPVLLIYKEEVAKNFRYDSKKEAIKVVSLDNKKVTKIQFVSTLKEFEDALK
jgi:hypothetical protein